ncbi:MAG: pyridoxamine 5'-phosphate oxidase family protein [Rhodospirillaceae bacterium]|nr:pyridoxamine 5'-phosphate oxidase family protein [Rhodospirillaceae bacterium]
MGHRFAEIAFTDSVKAMQEAMGSRSSYQHMEEMDEPVNQVLGANEAGFIGARDSFYMATVSETGWPYVQHRGGPAGFVRVLDEKTIGFADFRGNRQYISVGNVMKDNRVSLFFMDYAHRTRLKLLGRARTVDLSDGDLLSKLEVPTYRARVERGIVIDVEAFDWNCPQHIVERFTLAEIESAVAPLQTRIAELEAHLKAATEDQIAP